MLPLMFAVQEQEHSPHVGVHLHCCCNKGPFHLTNMPVNAPRAWAGSPNPCACRLAHVQEDLVEWVGGLLPAEPEAGMEGAANAAAAASEALLAPSASSTKVCLRWLDVLRHCVLGLCLETTRSCSFVVSHSSIIPHLLPKSTPKA